MALVAVVPPTSWVSLSATPTRAAVTHMSACKVVTLADARKILGADASLIQAPGSSCNYVTKTGAHLRVDASPSSVKPPADTGQRITIDGEKAYLLPDSRDQFHPNVPSQTALVSYRNGKAFYVEVSGTAHDRATAEAALDRALSRA
jgi:hypothetical protein